MRYLLDTHIFLWWLNNDKRLKSSVRGKIQDEFNQILVSTASALEMSIKISRGKLTLKTTIKKTFAISGFEVLDINLDHAVQLEKLPFYHKDPFDRILISQAKVENCILLTDDPNIKRYKALLL